MPNHIESSLVISGRKEEVDKFIEFARGKGKDKNEISANNFIPYPEIFKLLDKKNESFFHPIPAYNKLSDKELKELMILNLEGDYDINKDGYNQGGYEWCCVNWGTKWGFYDVTFKSPAYPVMLKMSIDFPNLTFAFKGVDEGDPNHEIKIIYKDGKENSNSRK